VTVFHEAIATLGEVDVIRNASITVAGAADSASREPRQAGDMRVRARLLEAKTELKRIDALR
jgi:hypothetical protein